MRLNQKIMVALAGAALATLVPSAAVFAGSGGNGNGMPSGSHYNLNIIGVPKEKTADMTGNNGHRIFVKLEGNTKIMLSEGEYGVLDANGTDGEAHFQLPNPDPDMDGVTRYSVFARALGTPGGQAQIATCTTAPGPDGVLGTDDDTLECNTGDVVVQASRNGGKPTTQNVSKELLFLWDVDLDGDGLADVNRIGLFDDRLQDYFWSYDNHGLKVLQLRFYPCSTDVGDTSGDASDDSACFNG